MDASHIFPPLRRVILESPLVREIIEEAARAERVRILQHVLERRFGAVTPTITADLGRFEDIDDLIHLTDHAAVCDSLQSFEDGIHDDSLRPTPSKRQSKLPAR